MMDTKSACAMLQRALEMEEQGKKVYDDYAANCANEECRAIFRMLAKDEVAHKERINTLYESLTSGEGWCEDWREMEMEYPEPRKVVLQAAVEHGKNIKAEASDVEALDVGMGLETESIDYYKGRLEDAEDPVAKEFLEKMVDEERTHFRALADMKLYLTNPEGWFRENEKTLLDGGGAA